MVGGNSRDLLEQTTRTDSWEKECRELQIIGCVATGPGEVDADAKCPAAFPLI